MTLRTEEVIHLMHQLSIPYLIEPQVFTYIKVYKSDIHSSSSIQDLGMPHYECQK
ncbi:Glycoprotein G [Gossypium arboreum]|uniref:Glycoprotein G n=1 Tax=Gossypium arboreum TaxID=29729 RepID=A0A0B0MRZ4_GOSAR|nr:Glycoprotein G [Gossypium arboreum]